MMLVYQNHYTYNKSAQEKRRPTIITHIPARKRVGGITLTPPTLSVLDCSVVIPESLVDLLPDEVDHHQNP